MIYLKFKVFLVKLSIDFILSSNVSEHSLDFGELIVILIASVVPVCNSQTEDSGGNHVYSNKGFVSCFIS